LQHWGVQPAESAMREYWFTLLAVLAICAILLTAGLSVTTGQRPPVRETEVVQHKSYVIFKQRDRTIYVKRQTVTGFTVYPAGFEGNSHPVIVVLLGAKEFRFDVSSKDKIEPIVDAFMGEANDPN
jgi:hypothetical protein